MGWPNAGRQWHSRCPEEYVLQAGGYFLQVGTLEPRKNHIAVARAVEKLRQKHGAEADRDLAAFVDPMDDAQVSEAIDCYLADSGAFAAARSTIGERAPAALE